MCFMLNYFIHSTTSLVTATLNTFSHGLDQKLHQIADMKNTDWNSESANDGHNCNLELWPLESETDTSLSQFLEVIIFNKLDNYSIVVLLERHTNRKTQQPTKACAKERWQAMVLQRPHYTQSHWKLAYNLLAVDWGKLSRLTRYPPWIQRNGCQPRKRSSLFRALSPHSDW